MYTFRMATLLIALLRYFTSGLDRWQGSVLAPRPDALSAGKQRRAGLAPEQLLSVPLISFEVYQVSEISFPRYCARVLSQWYGARLGHPQ